MPTNPIPSPSAAVNPSNPDRGEPVAFLCPCCGARGTTDGKSSTVRGPVCPPVSAEREALESNRIRNVLDEIAINRKLRCDQTFFGEDVDLIEAALRAALSPTDGRSSAGQSEAAGWNATQRELEILKLREELDTFRKAERSLSEAYVRLRALIPGAFDTPYAPEPEQIWEITENALKAALAPHCPVDSAADAMIGEIEKRFPNWQSFRDLVDCIDCTLHELRGSQSPAVSVSDTEGGR